jgi:2-oxo-hept-3-ene-1,7-dioate hydratase
MPQLSEPQILAAAARLDAAERNRQQIRSVSFDHPGMDIDDAYAIQKAWMQLKQSRGRRIIGRKVGLTSRAMQQAMRIDRPDFGVLLDDMVFAEGAAIEAAAFTDLRLEVEIAFVLGSSLTGTGHTLADVLAATSFVVPAVELIAARTYRIDPETRQPRGVVDTIADNAASAGIVTGGRPLSPAAVDLRWVGALLWKNGEIEESGVSGAVMNHPGNAVAWLANTFGALGERLEAGEIILSGSFTRPVNVAAGDLFHVDFGALGSFGLRFR